MFGIAPCKLYTCLALASAFGLLTMCAEPNFKGTDENSPEPAPVNTNIRTKISISPFPYDLSPNANQQVKKIIGPNRTMNSAVLNNGVPWQEALDGSPYPNDVMNEWKTKRDSMTPGLPVYLALQPLQNDHIKWANDHGGKAAPSWVSSARGADPKILAAYRNHVLRAIDYFKPDYLNLGVECGDQAAKKPDQWPSFVALYNDTKAAVKQRNPGIKVGLSWGLPLLMKQGVLQRCDALIANSDYVGISFYPYLGQFYSKLGGVSVPSSAPAQWREPYKWLRSNVRKPIAICETGYLSTNASVGQWGIKMQGSPELQSLYVEDLAQIAKRDGYLFVMFFLSVDYDVLAGKLGIDFMKFWEHSGFFDKNLKPKPAWDAYQRAWLGRDTGGTPAAIPPGEGSSPAPAPAPSGGGSVSIPMGSAADIFESTQTVSHLAPNGTRWQYNYSKGDWPWALKAFSGKAVAQTSSVSFEIKSSRSGPLIVQLEETDGEAHFKVIEAGSSWQTITIPFSATSVDPKKRENGRVDAGSLKSIMLADSQGVDGVAKGSRTVDISNLRFSR